MPAVVVLCEADGKGIRSASLPALAAAGELAKQVRGDVVAIVIGQGIGPRRPRARTSCRARRRCSAWGWCRT